MVHKPWSTYHALRPRGTDPFSVACVEREGDRHHCVFHLKRADLVVGYRSVIELQLRIDREFDILSVERHPLVLSSLQDRIS